MHPINSHNFGIHGIAASYYNGTSVVSGYITKQTGTNSFQVTDGTNPKSCVLAQTSTDLSNMGSGHPTLFTIPISVTDSGASGATFTPTYGVDASTTVQTAGAGYQVNDVLKVNGGVAATGTITVATQPTANDTVTVGGTVVTFVASGATGSQVNIGADAPSTATALYTFLSGSADANIVKATYALSGSVVTVIYATTGTAGNAFTLAASRPASLTLSGATLSGGVADIGSNATLTVAEVSSGGIVRVTVSAAGSFTTLPTGPVHGYSAGDGRIGATFNLKFKLLSMTGSGGTGYATGDTLSFVGMTATTLPTAHVTASSGAVSTVVVDTAGSGITAGASSITAATTEHVKKIYDGTVQTVEGNRYSWTLGTSVNGSAFVSTYS